MKKMCICIKHYLAQLTNKGVQNAIALLKLN